MSAGTSPTLRAPPLKHWQGTLGTQQKKDAAAAAMHAKVQSRKATSWFEPKTSKALMIATGATEVQCAGVCCEDPA
jgi:hypothetical protein